MDTQSLGTSQRILLAGQLWDSVRANSDKLELTREQTRFLESRLSAFETDGSLGDSWVNVKGRILKEL